MDFLESFSPVDEHGSETVMRSLKDLDADSSSEMPKPVEFANRIHRRELFLLFS